MSVNIPTGADRPDDGALVRYLDGEAAAPESAAVSAALRDDAGTRGALEGLRDASRDFSDLLDDVEVPSLPAAPWASEGQPGGGVTPRGNTRLPGARRLRLAAGIAILLGAGALAVSPVGATLARSVGAWLSALTTDPPPVAAPAEGEGGVVIAFAAPGPVLVVEVARVQSSGALVLEPVADADATARAEPGRVTRLVVTPDGLRVLNDGAGAGDIRVGLPASVEAVRVRIGGGAWRVVDTTVRDGPIRVPLGGG